MEFILAFTSLKIEKILGKLKETPFEPLKWNMKK
jgi:hypothetical protein